MKQKPDAMIALITLFFVGLVVSGFSSLTVGSNRTALDKNPSVSLESATSLPPNRRKNS
tara:strand:- start:4993 stop:5169 length:177 start_codon:yes stop_codon:yes gene_type:complete